MSPVTPELTPARRELHGHRKSVLALSWAHTGCKLASASADESVRTWNVEAAASAKPERSDLTLASLGQVSAVEWHPKRDDQLGVLTDKQLK